MKTSRRYYLSIAAIDILKASQNYKETKKKKKHLIELMRFGCLKQTHSLVRAE